MKMTSVFVLVSLLLGLASPAAAGIPATPAGQPVVPGEWHQGLSNVLELARQTGIPVVGFWANTGCDKCEAVISQAVNTQAFTAWRKARQLLMVTGEGKSGLAGELYAWVRAAAASDGDTSYPFLRVYWVQKDGTVRADYQFSGYPYRDGPQTLIDKIESFVAAFSYAGSARFASTPGLEMEPATAAVPLPLVRENGSDGVLTNTLTFVRTLEFGGTTNWTQTLVWAEDELTRTVTVPNEGHYVGGQVSLTLSAEGEPDQTVVVSMVAARAVTTANPRFMGEPFTFGEWTMDLTAATNAVATTNVTAYTLVLFTGALWCPYCMGMERDWLSTAAFKDFARTNNIALVALDNHRRDGSAPTLLRYDVYWGATNDTRNGNSGAGYLSRHGVSVAQAEAVLARNLAVQAEWTLPGATRIGYPTLLLLRQDGSIAGRTSGYYRMTDNTVVPALQSFDLQINMLRLNELLELARDPRELGEENNGFPALTDETLGARDTAAASLRASDLRDVYALQTAPGLRQTLAVSGPEEAAVQVSIVTADGQALYTQSGSLTGGVSVAADISGSEPVFAAVAASGPAVQVSSASATVRSYTLRTRFGLAATEAAQGLALGPYAEGDGSFSAEIEAVSNDVYRFVVSGAEFSAGFSERFEPLGGGLFRARSTGPLSVGLVNVSEGAALTWQVWHPGTVGFTQSIASVSETASNVVVAVRRMGGVSGPCSVAVSLDAANTTAAAGEDFEDVFGAGAILSWADGEGGTKTVVVPLTDDGGHEGDEQLALALEVTAGAAALAPDASSYRLTILENDAPVIGRVGFVSSSLPFAKLSPLTVVAQEGASVSLGVERVEGASGAVTARVAATSGELVPDALVWAHNDRAAVKPAVLTLPLLAQVPSGEVKVSLAPEGALRTVPGLGEVRVRLIASDAPVFAQDEIRFVGQTRVAFDRRLPVLRGTGGRLGFEKRMGALPAGLQAKADPAAGALWLTGVPRQSGAFVVVYQVWEIRGGHRVEGGVVRVTLTVSPLEALNAVAAGSVTAAEGGVVDSLSSRLVGTLTVSVSRAGRLTAKYLNKGGAVSFSGASWSACDTNGTVTAALVRGGYSLAVRLSADGEMQAVLSDPSAAGPLTAELARPSWSEANPASDYEGYYTVSLSPATSSGALAPSGYSYLTVSLRASAVRTGRVTYAGRLADGTAYSGSSVLQPVDGESAHFVVFQQRFGHVLAGLLSVAAGASGTYRFNPSAVSACGDAEPYWSYADQTAETAFDIVLDICGGYYNSADSLQDYYDLYAGSGPMLLMASGERPVSAAYGEPGDLPAVALTVSDSALGLPAAAANPNSVRLSFVKATGLFRGSFRLAFVNGASEVRTQTASYHGVLLPGWTGDCGCGEDEVELPEKPFGMGAYTYRDQLTVEAGGASRQVTVKRGYPMIMQKAAE